MVVMMPMVVAAMSVSVAGVVVVTV